MQISFGNLLVFVPDMEIADEFYEGVLGLERVKAGRDFRRLRGSGFDLVLFRCSARSSSDGYSEIASAAICFAVPDLKEAMTHLRERGVALLHDEPQTGDGLAYVAFEDPFGTVHEIVEYSS